MQQNNTMKVTCHKCGRSWNKETTIADAEACPLCGVHGSITLTNSHPVYDKNGRVIFFTAKVA